MRRALVVARIVALVCCCALLAACSLVDAARELAEPEDLYADIELGTWEGEVINPDDQSRVESPAEPDYEPADTAAWGSWESRDDDDSDPYAEEQVDSSPFEASPEALAFAAEAATKANHRFEMFLEYDIGGIGVVGSRSRPIAEGIATSAGTITEMDLGVFSHGPIKRRLPMATISIDNVIYVQSSLFGPLAVTDSRLTGLASLDGGWGYAVLDPELEEDDVAAVAGAGFADRDQMMGAMLTIDEVSEVSAGDVRGVATTRVHSPITDAPTLGQLLGSSFVTPEMMAAGLRGEIAVDVDEQSWLRRVELTIWVDDASIMDDDFDPGTALQVWMQFDLFDFGIDYEVTAPEQATDITDEIRLVQALANG